MSTPQKPWENNRHTNNQQHVGQGRNTNFSQAPQSLNNFPTSSIPVTVTQRAMGLPPLPQRPQQMFNRPLFASPGFANYPAYNSFNGGYSSPGFGGYSGAYGAMYGRSYYPTHHAQNQGFENRFLQVAEESSRDAFQSIESIVRAFTSVSMMLESTYFAIYSSFRAILGVVDNFSRLRQILVQFLSTITILKIIRNVYRRLLQWLGILHHSPQAESVWESVSGEAQESVQGESTSKWPLLTFLAVLFGGPYILSKFFSPSNSYPKTWDPAKGRFIRAAYPHQAGTDSEMSFQANERLNIAPQELQTLEANGWLMACNERGQQGFVPITRLYSKPPNPAEPAPKSSGGQHTKSWDPAKGHFIRAAYPHQAGTDSEMSFQANERLNIAPQELQTLEANGWLIACNERGQQGFVPITRLYSKPPNPAEPAPKSSGGQR